MTIGFFSEWTVPREIEKDLWAIVRDLAIYFGHVFLITGGRHYHEASVFATTTIQSDAIHEQQACQRKRATRCAFKFGKERYLTLALQLFNVVFRCVRYETRKELLKRIRKGTLRGVFVALFLQIWPKWTKRSSKYTLGCIFQIYQTVKVALFRGVHHNSVSGSTKKIPHCSNL